MKDLVNLIRMQYYSIYALRKNIAVIIAIALILSIVDSKMIIFSCALIVMGMNYSTAAYEDRSKMNHLIYSLPVEPKLFVLSKYIYGFINTILALVVSDILVIIMKVLNLFDNTEFDVAAISLSVILIGAVITVIVIPAALILGFERGRFVIVFLAVTPVCFSKTIGRMIQFPEVVINASPSMVTLMCILAVITITLASYFITSNLYDKKEIE